MTRPQPKISVFPKCYFDELCSGTRDYLQWLHDASHLGAEGIEHYDRFFRSFDDQDIEPVIATLDEIGQRTSMLCFSPDFTHPDPHRRRQEVERQKAAIDLAVKLGTRYCRTLSGQAYPGMSRAEGIARTMDGLRESLAYAEQKGVILCMENHYKDGNWSYPEFAQPEDIYLEIIGQIDSANFGVQFDPSNAIVGGYDPVAFLKQVKDRVVTMHASDRYLAEGATLEDLKQADGTIGYSDKLLHGVTGRGLNDYDGIFSILSDVGFHGWISVEDGINGLDEIRESVTFLKGKIARYYR